MRIVILGGGVAGLMASLRLANASLNRVEEIIVLEKQATPGGLLQSTEKGPYWWDNGAFAFHPHNPLVRLLPHIFEPVTDGSTKAWNGHRLEDFPLNVRDYMASQSLGQNIRTAADFILCQTRRRLKSECGSSEDWLGCRLPETLLSKIRIRTYLQKLQGRTPTELSPALGRRRLKYIDRVAQPAKLVRRLLGRGSQTESGPEMGVVYPRGRGVGSISTEVAELW